MLSSDSSCFLTKHLKNLDPSYKTNLDLWDYLGRLKLILPGIAKFHRTDLVICSQSEKGKPHLIAKLIWCSIMVYSAYL